MCVVKFRGKCVAPTALGRSFDNYPALTRTGLPSAAPTALRLVSDRPSLGLSPLSKTTFSTSKSDKLRRLVCFLVALVIVGAVFFYLTRAVQTSTAHATSDDSPLHYDPNAGGR